MSNQIQHIDQVCSHKAPIRLGGVHDFKTRFQVLEPQRIEFLKERYTGGGAQIEKLRSGLLKFGGSFTLIPGMEEDLEKLIARGQLWGATGKMLRGAQSQCHSNSALAWESNQDKLFLATGYALSEDGLWRQHSWCINPRPRSVQVVETTVERQLYFGFVMTLEETIEFADNNTDFGIEVHPDTYARYGLDIPRGYEKMRA